MGCGGSKDAPPKTPKPDRPEKDATAEKIEKVALNIFMQTTFVTMILMGPASALVPSLGPFHPHRWCNCKEKRNIKFGPCLQLISSNSSDTTLDTYYSQKKTQGGSHPASSQKKKN